MRHNLPPPEQKKEPLEIKSQADYFMGQYNSSLYDEKASYLGRQRNSSIVIA